MAIAITPDNRHLVTGDTQGIVRSWDLSTASAALAAAEPAQPGRLCNRGVAVSVAAVARWRAHGRGVSSAAALDEHPDLVLTSGQDCSVCLWSVTGAKVGTFGQVRGPRVVPCGPMWWGDTASTRRVVYVHACWSCADCLSRARGERWADAGWVCSCAVCVVVGVVSSRWPIVTRRQHV